MVIVSVGCTNGGPNAVLWVTSQNS